MTNRDNCQKNFNVDGYKDALEGLKKHWNQKPTYQPLEFDTLADSLKAEEKAITDNVKVVLEAFQRGEGYNFHSEHCSGEHHSALMYRMIRSNGYKSHFEKDEESGEWWIYYGDDDENDMSKWLKKLYESDCF